MTDIDSPDTVAGRIASMPTPALLVFDCDGVLAPLVDHADDSVLHRGVGDLLARLATHDGVTVAVLSGRSLDGLAQFDFHTSIVVAGSYGGERRGLGLAPLTLEEAKLLARLDDIVVAAADEAGVGAWVERKPTSVVVHVREAEPERRRAALELARTLSADLDGHELHEGSDVVELMARPGDKGAGIDRLRAEFDAASVLYVGDDVPDEDAFARLVGPSDVGVKVGAGDTAAGLRLADPAAVHAMLTQLTSTTA